MTKSTFKVEDYLEKVATKTLAFADVTAYATGADVMVPVLAEDGTLAYKPAVYLDNAATLPIFAPVSHYAQLLEERYRSNVGRSYGYKERLIRLATGQTRLEALKYFGAPKGCVAVLGTNVTALFLSLIKHINARHPRGRFLLSPMSHSATAMPIHALDPERWSHLPLDADYQYDLNALSTSLTAWQGHDVTIAIETISNVTGYETNWSAVVRLAEQAGARVILDNAQGACFVDVRMADYRCELFVGVSGHKMGARDGSAVLVGPQTAFDIGRPLEPTAGMIFNYTEDQEFFMPPPATVEHGTPNYIAQASLGESFRLLGALGFGQARMGIAAITAYLEDQLRSIDGVKVLGSASRQHRYGPLSFIAHTDGGKEIPAMAIAACLSYFHGIQVRANHHCAPVLIQRLKGISNTDANVISQMAMDHLGMPFDTAAHPLTAHLEAPADPLSVLHTVRPSVSFGTTTAMIDALVIALTSVLTRREFRRLKVVHNRAFGFNEYVPAAGDPAALRAVLFPAVTLDALASVKMS